jgi:hypothetical protein
MRTTEDSITVPEDSITVPEDSVTAVDVFE